MENRQAVAVSTLQRLLPITISLLLPFNVSAENVPPVGSVSGELLQNNPMLNAPLAPRSKGLTELVQKEPSPAKDNQAAKEKGPTLKVNHINVIDMPESIQQDVQTLVKQYAGNMMTLPELRAVAVQITALLQRQGELLSYAYIPHQQVIDGLVTIQVFNGHLEAMTLAHNSSLIKDKIINNYINRIFQRGLNVKEVERKLLAISDLPGVGEMTPFLAAGNEPGGSILNLELKPAPRLEGVAVFDNAGSISTGRNRIGLQVNVNSPLGRGDRLQALAYFSPDVMQINNDSKHGNTIISRVSYDMPINTNGTRAGVSYSKVNYKLGGAALQDLGDGFAEITSLYGSHALIRRERSNMTLDVNLDLKRMSDIFWEQNNLRTASALMLQLSGNIARALLGRPNVVQYQLAYTAGRLANNADWNGLKTKGAYFKATQNIQYQQGLRPGLIFKLLFNGQLASKNLDGAEKMSLGGPYAVRGYSNSAASVDSGWLVSAGLSYALPAVDGLTAELFYDYAAGDVQKFSKQPAKVTLRGYGIGLNYNVTSKLFINASYAWRHGREQRLQPQNKAMGWLTAGWRF